MWPIRAWKSLLRFCVLALGVGVIKQESKFWSWNRSYRLTQSGLTRIPKAPALANTVNLPQAVLYVLLESVRGLKDIAGMDRVVVIVKYHTNRS